MRLASMHGWKRWLLRFGDVTAHRRWRDTLRREVGDGRMSLLFHSSASGFRAPFTMPSRGSRGKAAILRRSFGSTRETVKLPGVVP